MHTLDMETRRLRYDDGLSGPLGTAVGETQCSCRFAGLRMPGWMRHCISGKKIVEWFGLMFDYSCSPTSTASLAAVHSDR